MAKDILKEAIADAKAVREVALANAKAALEEAFTPKLQNMLSAKLSEELDEDGNLAEMNYGEDDMDEDIVDEEYESEDTMEENLDEEIDLEEILNELELEEVDDSKENTVDEVKDEDLDEAKDKDEETMDEAKDEDLDETKKDEEKEDLDEQRPIYKAEYANDSSYRADHVNEGDEFDLDTLLEEINNLDEKEETEVNETEELAEESFGDTNEVVGTALAGMAGMIAAAGGMAKLRDMFSDPEMQAKYPTAAKVLDTLEDVGGAAGQAMRREQEEMATELEETQKALETVRGELNEVNLLNSKLLYVNRIFKANTLDEVQKLRVVESLDKAESANEAKLIYETIKDTFNISKSIKRTPKKTIKESLGMASKAAGTSTAPKKEVISESKDMVARFQKLANIKINQ